MNTAIQPATCGPEIKTMKTRSSTTETANSNGMASSQWGQGVARSLGLLLLMLASVVGRAQFLYETNNGAITITGNQFSGSAPGTAVIIPSVINGLPVARIGKWAFRGVTNLASVKIPQCVTNIEPAAFSSCPDLEEIAVDPLNPVYTSIDGVLFDKYQNVDHLF